MKSRRGPRRFAGSKRYMHEMTRPENQARLAALLGKRGIRFDPSDFETWRPNGASGSEMTLKRWVKEVSRFADAAKLADAYWHDYPGGGPTGDLLSTTNGGKSLLIVEAKGHWSESSGRVGKDRIESTRRPIREIISFLRARVGPLVQCASDDAAVRCWDFQFSQWLASAAYFAAGGRDVDLVYFGVLESDAGSRLFSDEEDWRSCVTGKLATIVGRERAKAVLQTLNAGVEVQGKGKVRLVLATSELAPPASVLRSA